MEGKKATIYLHTPILVATSQEGVPSHYERAIQSIIGKIRKYTEGGILIEVYEFIGERGESFSPPFTELFLPQHKIDHIYLT